MRDVYKFLESKGDLKVRVVCQTWIENAYHMYPHPVTLCKFNHVLPVTVTDGLMAMTCSPVEALRRLPHHRLQRVLLLEVGIPLLPEHFSDSLFCSDDKHNGLTPKSPKHCMKYILSDQVLI